LVINHNYKNNALLVAELNAIKASIPIINNYYNKQEIDGKINTINNKFDNKQERLNDLYKLFPNNIQVHPDLSSLGIKDNQFVSYSHTDREKYIFNLMANAFKTNSRDKFITFGSSYFLYYLEVKLDRKTLLSIY
jgi:spore coat protein CotH